MGLLILKLFRPIFQLGCLRLAIVNNSAVVVLVCPSIHLMEGFVDEIVKGSVL